MLYLRILSLFVFFRHSIIVGAPCLLAEFVIDREPEAYSIRKNASGGFPLGVY